jgi:hypothetical protein
MNDLQQAIDVQYAIDMPLSNATKSRDYLKSKNNNTITNISLIKTNLNKNTITLTF